MATKSAFAASLLSLALASPLALAEPQAGQALAPLDGFVFEASIVRRDGEAGPAEPLIDRLTFDGGQFSSRICERYGFVPGAYWVRGEPGAIEFHAVLHSPTDGTMEWTGTVTGDALEGTMRWTRPRWYWTVRAEHRIAGRRTEADPARPVP
jgi:hypothetical protein